MRFLFKLLSAVFVVSLTIIVDIVVGHAIENPGVELKVAKIVVDEPVVMHTNGGVLLVSTLNAVERYEQVSEKKFLGLSRFFARLR